MGWFRNDNVKPDFTGLQIQTSTAILPIPIVWGQAAIGGNVIWYQNFQSRSQGGGKGGLLGGGGSQEDYAADVIIAISEGPIGGVRTVWKDQSAYTLAGLGLTAFNGTTPQSVWGYLTSAYPTQALAYQGTAYVAAASYDLGGSASIGNHLFEVLGLYQGTAVNQIDADPAQVIYDFLTNPQYGAGFSAASIDATTLFGAGGDASLQTYCKAVGLGISPALVNAEQASSILTRWLQIVNCGAVWSQGLLRFIPYGDQAIAAGNVLLKLTATVPQQVAGSAGSATNPPMVTVCPAANFVADGGVVYANSGIALSHTSTNPPTSAGTYAISPDGTYVFSPADTWQIVAISYTNSVAAAYAPNLTPVYALTDLDFVDDHGAKDPVQVSRVDPFSLPNIVRLDVASRNNRYASLPVEARDQAQIELYGPRVATTITAHEICDDVTIAPIVAQTILQRQLYVRTHFTFKLSWEYCLLDPMDIVELTDSNLGLSAYPARITSIEEDDNGLLTITAEELTVGVSTPAANPRTGTGGFLPNRGATAAAVNAPLIYEPPPELTGNVAQVWVGASGGSNGVADPNWGGAYVYLSLDNVSFSQIATITKPLRQGVLTAPLAAAGGWDTTDTLAVNLAQSGGALTGTSATSAEQGATLALVDNELLAYESATLTASNAYNLTGLERGMYGTTGAAHASGATFNRLDDAVVKYDLPSQYVGKTLYFKFQSFNVFSAGAQAVSSAAVYTYTAMGSGALGPVTQALLVGTSMDWGLVRAGVSESDDWGGAAGAIYASVDLGALMAASGGATWSINDCHGNTTVSGPGVYLLWTSGLTLALPTAWPYTSGLVIKDMTGAANPGHILCGVVDGCTAASPMRLVNPYQGVRLDWSPTLNGFIAS